jgi:tellurite resistance protein TehA-like permease
MTTSVEPRTTATDDTAAPVPGTGSRWLGRVADCLSSSEHPRHLFGPNWFASAMGIGIVANAAAGLPILASDLHVFSVVVWVIAALWLLVLLAATSLHWLRNPDVARGYIRDPMMGQFYGAPPMALMTVGAGALLAGHSIIGTQAATDIDWVLWTAGTIGGLLTAVTIPYLLFTHYPVRPDGAFGGWLMPVVPPMVSAATGALLIPHIAAGAGRETLLYGCYALFGTSVVASLIIITMIWSRLAHFGSSGTVRVPTLWIVLGPLGQSITATGLLGSQAHLAVSGPLASSLRTFSVLYGVPVWGFAMLWIALAASLTARTIRHGLPFALTWWSLTFPIGTFVTGTTALAAYTALPAFQWAAVLSFGCLLAAVLLVASRTVNRSVTGELLAVPAAPPPPVVAVKG